MTAKPCTITAWPGSRWSGPWPTWPVVLPRQRAGLPGIEEGRAELIVGGALVLATLMAHFGFEECLVSESDILDGLVLTMRTEPGDRARRHYRCMTGQSAPR